MLYSDNPNSHPCTVEEEEDTFQLERTPSEPKIVSSTNWSFFDYSYSWYHALLIVGKDMAVTLRALWKGIGALFLSRGALSMRM